MEVFQYYTLLYLNTEYYTIMIYTQSRNMTTILTKFGKLRHNRLPMGMCTCVDVLKDILDKLLGEMEVVKT